MYLRRLLPTLLLASGCAQCPDPIQSPGSPVTGLHYPTGLALHPTEPVLLVANSNFDLGYATGSVVGAHLGWLVQHLQRNDRYEGDIRNPFSGGVLVPSFGGPLAMGPGGDHVLHTTRGDNRLVELELSVRDDGVTLSCGNRGGNPPDCTGGDHVLQLPYDDPYGLVAVQGAGNATWWVVSFLRSGKVVAGDRRPSISGSDRLFIGWEKNLGDADRGGSLLLLPSVAGNPQYLLSTGREVPGTGADVGHLRMLNFWRGPQADPLTVDLREQVGALDVRGVAYSAARQKAYAVTKTPPAVVELDMRRIWDGSPTGRATRIAQIGKEPSVVALYEPANGPSLVLTASFRDDVLLVLDMDTLEVVAALRDIGDSPFEIAVDNARSLAFVSNFNDDTVAVVRLPQDAQDSRLFVAARLGIPRERASNNPDLPIPGGGVIPSLPVGGL
ncbi:MAG: hypothetical protein AB2A00_37305 [Myxococcota bacterium]